MGDVIDLLNLETKLDIPPDRILEAAVGKLDEVVLCGWDKNGKLYGASSTGDIAKIIYLLELCKRDLLTDEE